MTHTDAKRALRIVALSSARIEILAGCDCRNPQVQILGAQPALLAAPCGSINLAQCEIDAYCPKGSAHRSGRGGRRFKSCHSELIKHLADPKKITPKELPKKPTS